MSNDAPSQGRWPLMPEQYFGQAGTEWRAAIEALHKFAQLTGAPGGDDVVDWFAVKTDQFIAANRERSSPQKDPTP